MRWVVLHWSGLGLWNIRYEADPSASMLTLFTTAKPFRGHIGLIQRNALGSWKRIHPHVEVVLFGDDEGAAEACRALCVRHEPFAERNEYGTKYLRSIFLSAQEIARHPLVCYANCDIILTPAFAHALARAASAFPEFLMVGRRWDTNITEPLHFPNQDWASRVERLAQRSGRRQGPQWIDYFAFSRGLYTEIPPLVIGRVGWDNWLVWRARASGHVVIDATSAVTAIHQNHDYSYHPQGATGVWGDEQARRNFELAGGARCLFTIEDATHRLSADGISRRAAYRLVPLLRTLRGAPHQMLSSALRATRPVRHALGMRVGNLKRLGVRLRAARRGRQGEIAAP